MKKVNAYQINPAYQDSNIFDEEFERCFVDGGRRFDGIHLDELNQLVDNWESCIYNIGYCDTNLEIENTINYWMEIQDEEKILALRKFAKDWGNGEYEIDRCCLLNIVYGGDWDYVEIRGCCQGDYAILYYDKEYWENSDIVTEIEVRYFNTGSEWRIDDDGEEVYLYCISWRDDDIKNEIASAFDYDVDDIIFHKWTGEKRVDVYEEF